MGSTRSADSRNLSGFLRRSGEAVVNSARNNRNLSGQAVLSKESKDGGTRQLTSEHTQSCKAVAIKISWYGQRTDTWSSGTERGALK